MVVKPLAYSLSALIATFVFFLMTSSAFAAAPTMTAVISDQSGDGRDDRVVITFSEATDVVDGVAEDGLTSLAIGSGCTIPVGDYARDGQTTLTISGLTGCTVDNTGIVPTITYTEVASCATAMAICDDALANQMANGANTVSVDGAKPVIKTAVTGDNDADGSVDRLVLTFSEAVNFVDGGTDNDFTLVASSGTATITAAAYTLSSLTTLTYTVTTLVTGNTSLTITPTYATAGAGSIIDGASNEMADARTIAGTDGAAPVLMTLSPVNGATNVSRSAVITMTFSEIISSLTYTPVGSAVSNYTPNITAAAVTLTPIGLMASGYHSFNILTAPDAGLLTFAGVSTTAAANITDPFSFTTTSSTAVIDDTSADVSTVVLVTSPNGGEELVGGSTQNITWSATTDGSIGGINISYTTDAGVTYNSIVTNTTNDGTYSWTVPSIDAASVFVKVEATDLVETLASDSSNSAFSIATAVVDAPSTDTTGLSPLTGLVEDISVVTYGNYIKSPSYDTVYFVDYGTDGSTLIRRPFNDHQTFFTYEDNFSNLLVVTDATLPTLSLGVPMMPKPGVVLVKIQSVAKVYAIGTDGELRWVTSEGLAATLYGSNWSDYVIDIPDTLYPRFEHGADMESSDYVNRGAMKTRAVLNQ
jgi:hypothetical protein